MTIELDNIDISFRDYEDFIIIYNLITKEILRLEDVAADIWRVIANGAATLNEIVDSITKIYDCNSADVETDIQEFIKALYQSNVIRINGQYIQNEPQGEEAVQNDSLDYEGTIIQEMQRRNQIYSVTFEMTYKCNERCIHCYANYPTGSDTDRVISPGEYKKILDELYDMNCMHIAFTGGDPFVYDGFFDVFSYARKKGFVCDIYTNGQYLADHQDVMNQIISLRPRAFYISLYGSNASVHDSITSVPGSFDKTINTIYLLKKKNISVVLNIMILSNNCRNAREIVELAKSLNVEFRVGMSLIYKNDGDSSPMDYFIRDKEEIKRVLQIVRENFYSMDVPADSIKEGESICGAGSTALSIAPDGNVYPCISLKVCLGNIFESSISDIWKSKTRINLKDSLKWENAEDCMKCQSKNECPHCIGISNAENGDMFSCNTCDRLIAECLHEISLAQ